MIPSRIVHVVPSLGTGGAERVVVDLLAALSDRCEAHLISMFDRTGAQLERRVEEAGITVHYLGKRYGKDGRMFSRISAVLVAVKPEIIHTHMYGLAYCPLALLRMRHAMWFHTIHNIALYDAGGSVGYYVNRLAFQMGVRPVAISERLRLDVASTYRRATVPVVPNGIPVNRFRRSESARGQMRATFGFGAKDVVFTSVASLWPVKNHGGLLKAFGNVARRYSTARLLIVGDGILRAQLAALCGALGLDRVVTFLGERGDVPEILSASDVFVSSSFSEGNPLSIMEAMAASLPVIAPRIGGIPDLVTDASNGVLVSAEMGDELSEAMCRLTVDEERRRSMGTCSLDKARRNCDISLMADRYWQLYCHRGSDATEALVRR